PLEPIFSASPKFPRLRGRWENVGISGDRESVGDPGRGAWPGGPPRSATGVGPLARPRTRGPGGLPSAPVGARGDPRVPGPRGACLANLPPGGLAPADEGGRPGPSRRAALRRDRSVRPPTDRSDEDPHGSNPTTSPGYGPKPPGDLSPGDQRDGPADGGRG